MTTKYDKENVVPYLRGKKYYAEYYMDGSRKRVSLKTSNMVVASEKILQLIEELNNPTKPVEVRRYSVKDAVDEFLESHKIEGCSSGTLQKYETTYKIWRKYLENHRLEFVDEINVDIIDSYRRWLSESGRNNITIHAATQQIKALFTFAFQHNRIKDNPLAHYRNKKPKPNLRPSFTVDDVQKIITNAEPPEKDIFTVLAYTGMRIGELQHLEWKNVDFDNRMIHIVAKKGWSPKTGESRIIPMNDTVCDVLKSLPKDHALVFTARHCKKYPKGGHMISSNHLLERLKRLMAKLEMPLATIHTFRHFFVSFYANQGVPPYVLMSWSGHKDLKMVLRYYHLTHEESVRWMQKIGATHENKNNTPNPPGTLSGTV